MEVFCILLAIVSSISLAYFVTYYILNKNLNHGDSKSELSDITTAPMEYLVKEKVHSDYTINPVKWEDYLR